jgi:hypothetical protein
MIAFLAILFILVVIYALTKENFIKADKSKEGFDTYSSPPDHKVNIPVNVIPPQIPPPPARNMSESNAQPHDQIGDLPIAPYEQLAHASPLPYQDPTLIKAKRQEIINTLEDLKGFLAFQAQEISENSDPAIQLPLNNARADFKRLQDTVYLLQRNPGLQPDLTETNLYEIQQNLAYLQRTVNLIGAAGPLQGPKYEFTRNVTEGFEDKKNNYESGDIATLEDLQDFIAKISAEIIRLSASGTTDPVINARVVALTQVKQNIQTIIDQVQSGALMSVEIPVLKKDIINALPVLGKPSEPLPQIIQTLQLPQGLANLLPTNIQNDPNTLRQINTLIDKYANDIVKGISASFSIKYTSPRDASQKEAPINSNDDERSSITKSGFPSVSDLNNINKPVIENNNKKVSDEYANKPADANRGPSHFDWKTRAIEITSQIKKRGLDPEDFGIMKDNTKVSDDFSWKGYTRMICTRLQATMDPGLPETCGCPPMNWKGWKIANY